MYVTLAGTEEKITMIEAGAREVSEEVMLDAVIKGHSEIKKITAFIKKIAAEIGKPKFEYESAEVTQEIFDAVSSLAHDAMCEAVLTDDKSVRDQRVAALTEEIQRKLAETYPESSSQINEAIYKLEKKIVRRYILDEGKRVDGRRLMR